MTVVKSKKKLQAPKLRLKVQVNDERPQILGLESCGVISTAVTWVHYTPEQQKRVTLQPQLHVGGLDSIENQFLDWRRGQLKIGDRVSITVLPAGEFDQPKRIRGKASPLKRAAEKSGRQGRTSVR